MSNAKYDVLVTEPGKPDGFYHHVTNEYRNMSPAVAAKVAAAGNGVVAALNKHADPKGELTAVLSAEVDGKTIPVPTITLTQEGYNLAQRDVHTDGDAFLKASHQHAKDKKAKHHGKP